MNSSFQNLLAERYLQRASLQTFFLPENARRPFLEPKIAKVSLPKIFFFFLNTFFLFKGTHTNYLHCSHSTYNTTLNTYSTYNTTLNTYTTYNTTLNTYSTYNTTLNTYSTYNTIQYSRKQYNAIQYNTIQYNTIQYNTIQYNTILTLLLKGSDCGANVPKAKKQAKCIVDQDTLMTERRGLLK